jgi:hypothetical protein
VLLDHPADAQAFHNISSNANNFHKVIFSQGAGRLSCDLSKCPPAL